MDGLLISGAGDAVDGDQLVFDYVHHPVRSGAQPVVVAPVAGLWGYGLSASWVFEKLGWGTARDPGAAAVRSAGQFDCVLQALAAKLPAVAAHLEAARPDILAFTAFPKAIWRQIWSNNRSSA